MTALRERDRTKLPRRVFENSHQLPDGTYWVPRITAGLGAAEVLVTQVSSLFLAFIHFNVTRLWKGASIPKRP